MSNSDSRIVSPGPTPRTVRLADGQVVAIPAEWILQPPGDAALTRRIKAQGEYWLVQARRGRRLFSQGVWVPETLLRRLQTELAQERQTDSFARRQVAAKVRRDREQSNYEIDFLQAVLTFLDFHPDFSAEGERLARLIAEHATPVGSGTVARTKRIPLAARAAAATIAWMRHQTTAYDSLKIPRVRGKRREVRRELAQQSQRILESYRAGIPARANCPLWQALKSRPAAQGKLA